MKVKELIEELKKLPQESEIRFGTKFGMKTNASLVMIPISKVEQIRSWVVLKSEER